MPRLPRALFSMLLALGLLLLGASLVGAEPRESGEVIIIHPRDQPVAVRPRPKNFKAKKTPPYSDRAITADAWTRAWLLLDVDESGAVTRFKFLKQPGYDLEKIAAREAFKLRFEPARDAAGHAMRTLVVWKIEWPAYWWLVDRLGVASRVPPMVGFPPRSMADAVPCAGSGPMELGSIHPTYRDCSKPDLKQNLGAVPWVVSRPTRRPARPAR